MCQRYARDRDQAIEAANDGFLQVFRDLGRFDDTHHPTDVLGSFRGWLKRIMVHTAIDHYRANERHQHQQELDDATLNQAAHDAPPLDLLGYDELLTVVALVGLGWPLWPTNGLVPVALAPAFADTDTPAVALCRSGWRNITSSPPT